MSKMKKWQHIPSYCEKGYKFNGHFFLSMEVVRFLEEKDMLALITEIHSLTEKMRNLDYKQLFKNTEKNQYVLFIDKSGITAQDKMKLSKIDFGRYPDNELMKTGTYMVLKNQM